jgi:hypothetical protein
MSEDTRYRKPCLPDDYGKPARFSDTGVTWTHGTLGGYWPMSDDDDTPWLDEDGKGYQFCEVEDVE